MTAQTPPLPPSSFRRAGVMGWPIKHSLSPKIHTFWLQAYDIPGSYQAFAVQPPDLAASLRNMQKNGLVGVNLTIPHKVAAAALVDDLDAAAKRIGAVNLVTIDAHGHLLGRNTDAFGFEQNLLFSGFKGPKNTAFVLGAGGACRAVLVALQNMGFKKIRLANRTKEHAEKLAHALSNPTCSFDVTDWKHIDDALADIDLLVNTTPLGMSGQPALSIALDALPRSACVTDIVYAPLETDLLRRAAQHGCKIIDGLGMLMHQARPAFEAFFGPDPEVTEALRNHILMEKK